MNHLLGCHAHASAWACCHLDQGRLEAVPMAHHNRSHTNPKRKRGNPSSTRQVVFTHKSKLLYPTFCPYLMRRVPIQPRFRRTLLSIRNNLCGMPLET